jgi:hypothetical protein
MGALIWLLCILEKTMSSPLFCAAPKRVLHAQAAGLFQFLLTLPEGAGQLRPNNGQVVICSLALVRQSRQTAIFTYHESVCKFEACQLWRTCLFRVRVTQLYPPARAVEL